MTQWATANVRTGRESEISSILAQRGREVYYPTITQWRRPRFKRKPMPVQSPAMPGYIFIQRDTIGDSEELYMMENFHYFLLVMDRLALLEHQDIEWIRSNMETVEKPRAKALRTFKLFDRVRVPEGPFGGMAGLVTGVMKQSVWVGGKDFRRPVLFPVLLLEMDVV